MVVVAGVPGRLLAATEVLVAVVDEMLALARQRVG
jgi:hypothetical protein